MQEEQVASNNSRFLELHSRYDGVEESEFQNDTEYVEYRLLLISDPASRAYVQSAEMEQSGFERVECCTALDFMIFKGQNKSKAVMLKWADGMYGISVHGKKDELHQIQFCPWCGSKLDKSGN